MLVFSIFLDDFGNCENSQEKSILMVGSVTCSQGWGLFIGSVPIHLDFHKQNPTLFESEDSHNGKFGKFLQQDW